MKDFASKTRVRVGVLVIVAGLAAALPAVAQTTTPSTATTGMTTSSVDRRDDGFNWGWLGLIGLAGLAGLRRKDNVDDAVRNRPGGAVR